MSEFRRVFIDRHPTRDGYTLNPHWTDTAGGRPVAASLVGSETYPTLDAAKAAALALYGVEAADVIVVER